MTARVLFLCHGYGRSDFVGGIESYTRDLSRALTHLGCEVHILALSSGVMAEDLTDDGVNVHVRPVARIRGPRRVMRGPWTSSRIEGMLAASHFSRHWGSIDVVEAPSWGAEHLLLALRGWPVITTLVTPLSIVAAENWQSMSRDQWLADRLERWAVKRSRAVVSDSDFHLRELRRMGWLKTSRVATVPLPVAVDDSDVHEPDPDDPYVLQVGRLEGRKRPEWLIRALQELTAQGKPVRAVFVGPAGGDSERQAKQLQQLASEAGVGVEIILSAPDAVLRSLRRKALAVSMVSSYESLGLAALEALAIGCPAIVSDRTGIAELVRGTGLVYEVPVGDSNRISDVVWKLLEGPDGREQARRDFVKEHLSPLVVAQQHLELYSRLGLVGGH